MGYITRAEGIIRIVPPVKWNEVKNSPYLPQGYRSADDKLDLAFVINESQRDTPEGLLLAREVVGIKPRWEEEARNYRIVENLQEIANTFRDRAFVGRFDMEGEESGDIWRLKMVGRIATRFEPEIVWPEGSE